MGTSADSNGRAFCNRCDVDLPVRPEYLSQWLTAAVEDAVEAKNSESRRHALFWVQQSTEKMVKAWRLIFGACYCDVVNIGHRSLEGLQVQMTKMFDTEPTRSLLRTTFDLDTKSEMTGIRRRLGRKGSKWEVTQWDKDVIKQLLNTIYIIQRKIEDQADSIASSELGDVEYRNRNQFRNDLAARLLPYLKAKGYKVMAGFMPLMLNCLEHSFSPYGLCEHQLEGQRIPIRGDNAIPRLRDGEIVVRLYILSAITFPHEAALRYPAHPNAPKNLNAVTEFEAKRGGKVRKGEEVGFTHYSEEIGAIYHVLELAETASRTANLMESNLESFAQLASIRPQFCAVCDQVA